MADVITQSQFNQRLGREVYVWGPDAFIQDVRKCLEPLSFVRVFPFKQFRGPRQDLYFVVGYVDFQNKPLLQALIRDFLGLQEIHAKKIVHVMNPLDLDGPQMLCAVEMGAAYTTYGKDRDVQLRAYVKRMSIQAEQLGTLQHFETEAQRFIRMRDHTALKQIDERLAGMDKDIEEVLRLRVSINHALNRGKIAEGFLKRILQINPQNLWAANELGKMYLRQHRAAEGIEILQKLSMYHELNGERLLQLGDAYLNCGEASRAEKVLNKGGELNNGLDQRFNEGVAKARLLTGDAQGALAAIKDLEFSEAVVAFLNVRAIMAIKNKRFSEGFALYQEALARGPSDPVIKAKLSYNFGLGCVRGNEPEKAVTLFEDSIRLGGDKFRRAHKPLEISKKILKIQERKRGDMKIFVDELEFEEFNQTAIDPAEFPDEDEPLDKGA